MFDKNMGCREQISFRSYGTIAIRITALVAVAAIATGCATAKSYTVDHALVSSFQEPVVPDDKTGVYFIRGDNFTGSGRSMWVAVNDEVVASLPNASHVYLELDAGLNTLHVVQSKAGYGFLPIDNKPGEIVYAKFGYATTGLTETLEEDLGKTMVMQTKAQKPLFETRPNNAYDNLLLNPGVLDYPIMTATEEEPVADADHAVVRFYRPDTLIAQVAFDVWNQDGYVGSVKGGDYFSVKLKPGRHIFISRSERYSVLEADLEANKEYAAELSVHMGWNQAHIKLLPMDLRKSSDSKKVEGWAEELRSTVVDAEVFASDPIATRVAMGHDYWDNIRQAVNSDDDEFPRRYLPAEFGN